VTRVDGGDCDFDGQAAAVAKAGGGGAAMNRRDGGDHGEAEPEALLGRPVAEPLRPDPARRRFREGVRSLGYASDMAGRTYAENRPYKLPDTLGELAGPVTGTVQLPLRLDWSERAVFHLDDPAERNVMYERVIREATQADDLHSYLNESVLRRVWRRLFLPPNVRRSWEQRFPDLRLAA
jgi:hypothetical protein